MAFLEIEKSIQTKEWCMNNLHSHPHYEIYFLTKGSRSWTFSNKIITLCAPCIIIVPPEILHMTEGGPFVRYNANVLPNYFDEYQKDIVASKTLKIIKPTLSEADKLIYLFEEMLSVNKHARHGEYILNLLFSTALYEINKLKTIEESHETILRHKIPPLILKVVDFINKEYMRKLTLEEIANKFFISKGALMYNFKRYMDCSLIDHLLSIRISKAKEYLLNTKKSIEEISELCGFSSSNYFGLIFKRKENLSPANFRKHNNTKK